MNEFSSYLEELELLKTLLITTVNDNLKLWKQTYDWFPDFYRGKPNEDFMTYKLGSEYRNLVTYHSAIIYDNYVPILKKIKALQSNFISSYH